MLFRSVALAAALHSDRCEIYTDVAGIYSADPRVAPSARPLRDIGYDEMLELATTGARVMHARAVEVGALYDVEILVASTFDEAAPGTIIHRETTMEQANKVRGIAHQSQVAKVTVRAVPDRPGIAAHLFEPLAAAHISVDTIVQNVSRTGTTDVSFTVPKSDVSKTTGLKRKFTKKIKGGRVLEDRDIARVSIEIGRAHV